MRQFKSALNVFEYAVEIDIILIKLYTFKQVAVQNTGKCKK